MIIEGNDRIYLGCAATILGDDVELAWAEDLLAGKNPAYKYILGKYAEADNPNRNHQFTEAAQLEAGMGGLVYSPLNINHTNQIVGNFIAANMAHPSDEQSAAGIHPHMEALSVFWKERTDPETLKDVEKAHSSNSLFYSMEARPESLKCDGEKGCGQEMAYVARFDTSYCVHMNNPSMGALRNMQNPKFLGGALIVPPVKPGWSNASIEEISQLIKNHDEEMADMHEQLSTELPDASDTTLEQIMIEMLLAQNITGVEEARQFAAKARHALAKSGAALPDGSFPIVTTGDLKNAIQAIGRASDPAAAKSHIKRRASSLGASEMLPATW